LTDSNGKKNGGPAFPHIDSGCGRFEEGMTLRDYFAAKALQGLFFDPSPSGEMTCDISAVYARIAYEYADAMLEARK